MCRVIGKGARPLCRLLRSPLRLLLPLSLLSPLLLLFLLRTLSVLTSSFRSPLRLLRLTPLLFLPLLLLLLPTPASAAHCAYDLAGEDVALVLAPGGQNVEIFLVGKETLGTARFQSAAIEWCTGEDAVGAVVIEWLDENGNVLPNSTQTVNDNEHDTWTPPTNYTGPVRVRATVGADTATSNYFAFVAPRLPWDATRCTAGPDNTCLDFDPLPSYAIGGQVYNQFFNSRLQTLYTAAPTTNLPKNDYFPNLVYKDLAKTGIITQGLYADDTTHIPTQYVLFYWWLTAGSEGFPAWTVTHTNDVRGTTGAAINLQTLVASQGRTLTAGTSYYGYIALVADRTVADFVAGGWFAQFAPAQVGSPAAFVGVWRPVNSGTYSGGTTNIPEDLNGGYFSIVRTTGERMLRLVRTVSGTGLIVRGDGALSGYLSFYPTTNSREVNYTVQLLDIVGQQLQSIWVSNSDGLTLPWIPFSFITTSPTSQGIILVKEESRPKYPALVIDIKHEELKRDLIPPTIGSGLARFLAAPSTQTSDVRQAILGISAAWGLSSSGVGATFAALTATGILFIAVLGFIGMLPVALFAALLTLTFFVLVGALHPAWLILIFFAMVLLTTWRLFGATA